MATAPAARRSPYRPPPPGAPLRLAFVGEPELLRAHALDGRSALVEFDDADVRASVEAFRPHAVVVLRAEALPPGLFAGLDVPVLGFLTEPVPRTFDGRVHEDVALRRRELEQVDQASFDRLVSFDPHVAETAAPVWRALPLPVADRYYGPIAPMGSPPRALFVGRATEHREWMLSRAELDFEVVRHAFGDDKGDVGALLREHQIAVNIHHERYMSFESSVLVHLAAGHLLITEALAPLHGLEPGIDYVEVDTPDYLGWLLEQIARFPSLYHPARVRGRQKAEQYRASRVYPRLIADLFADLEAFGSPRSPA
jgi:hypothetical protein